MVAVRQDTDTSYIKLYNITEVTPAQYMAAIAVI